MCAYKPKGLGNMAKGDNKPFPVWFRYDFRPGQRVKYPAISGRPSDEPGKTVTKMGVIEQVTKHFIVIRRLADKRPVTFCETVDRSEWGKVMIL